MIWVFYFFFFYFVQDQIGYILYTSNMERGTIETIVCEKEVILLLKCLSTVRSVRNISRVLESPWELLVV